MLLTPPYQAEVFRIAPKNFTPIVEVTACYIHFNNKFLFLHRAPETPQGYTWGIPAGKMEQGENPLQSIIREVSEEVGIILDENKVDR